MSLPQSDAQPFTSRYEDHDVSVGGPTQIGGSGLWARITQVVRPAFISGLGVVCLFGFAVGVAMSVLVAAPAPVVAQEAETCPLTTCDFGCTNSPDPWFVDGATEGIWMIVHAVPVKQPTNSGPTPGAGTPTPTPLAATPQVWRETGSPDNYPKMKVIGYWEDASNNTFTAEVRVNDDGSCYYGNDPDNRIRCHEGIVLQSDGDHLCDNFTGVWDRIVSGSSGTTTGCFSEIKYGIDFQKEFTDDENVEWCFQKAEVTSLSPGNGNTLKARSNCTTSSNLIWDREKTAVVWTCQAKEEQRPGGSVDRLDVTLNWVYR